MDMKPMIFLATLTALLAAAPGHVRADEPPTGPSPGGPASHSEILGGDTPQGKAEIRRQEAALKQSDALNDSGERLLDAKQFAAAEADFREALAQRPDIPFPCAGLAEALSDQGRYAEALDVYRTLFADPNNLSSTAQETRVRMGYAIALSRLGHWREAVAVYEKTIPDSPNYGDAPKIEVHFDPHVPMPAQLQGLAYVAIGIEYEGHSAGKRAYLRYEQALRTDPSSAFTNYYYGYGWSRLDPKDRSELGGEQQAKRALQKAVKIGKGAVKKAARKALLVAMRTK